MSLTAIPPKEAITPRKKQKFYDFAIETFRYASWLEEFKTTEEFENLSEEEKELTDQELEILETLNEFQVSQINKF